MNVCLVTLQLNDWYKDAVKYGMKGKLDYSQRYGISLKVRDPDKGSALV
jgi:hypothetical protein